MNLKLDENLGRGFQQILAGAGHDASTVREQRMSGASDETLYERCRIEACVLVTLDLDFSDSIRFPTESGPGIVVLRTRDARISLESIAAMARLLSVYLEHRSPRGALWILEPHRLRIREPNDA